jgi:hypothetical protein
MFQAQLSKPLAVRHARLSRRRPQPVAALQAGLVAGAAALFLLQFLGIVIYDESPWKLMRMIAAMARGPGVLEPDDEFNAAIVATGLALFFALSMLYALALSPFAAEWPRRLAPAFGIACGAALYYVNFYGFTAMFPWFASFRTVDTFLVHVVFGLALVRGYRAFRRRAR